MRLVLLSVVSLAMLAAVIAEKTSYTGYKQVEVFPQNNGHLELLAELEGNPELDFWTEARRVNDSVTIVLSPSAYTKYSALFKSEKMPVKITVNNVQDLIDEEARSMANSILDRANTESYLHKYLRYADIQAFITQIKDENPDIASIYTAGQSVEKRNLNVLKLGKPSATRGIYIDCGIHAREWVSPAACVYIIHTMIAELRANDPVTVALFNKYEFHILPLVNPDGYEFSHTTTRLWRKNRRVNTGSCLGVDLNRNFGYKWFTGGSSSSTCSDTYAGPSADSEPEVKACESIINAKPGFWDSLLTLHTYGQWWLTPWGDTTVKPVDYQDLFDKGTIGANALYAIHNTKYVVGPSSTLLYITSGTTSDWGYGKAGIKYSYTIELQPGQNNPDASYGFTLPVDRTPKVNKETWIGIKAFLDAIRA